jgi:hypothetical protein
LSPWQGADVALEVVAGRGLSAAADNRQFDRDTPKNFAVRYSQDVGPVRLGAFGYRGEEKLDGVRNTTWVWGPDATIPLRDFGELNAQFLRRTDRDPFYGACSAAAPCPGGATTPFGTTVDALLAEAIVWPGGPAGRLYLTGVYNYVRSDRPVVSLRLGEQATAPGYLSRYETLSGGAHWVYRRNVRLMTELGWDLARDRARFIAGTVLAF